MQEYLYNALPVFFHTGVEDDSMNVNMSLTGTAGFTEDTYISDVINDPSFKDYGRLLFPVDTGYYSGDTLENLKLTWYTGIQPDKTVEIVNYLKAKMGYNAFALIYRPGWSFI